jgi:hypothetical protein
VGCASRLYSGKAQVQANCAQGVRVPAASDSTTHRAVRCASRPHTTGIAAQLSTSGTCLL